MNEGSSQRYLPVTTERERSKRAAREEERRQRADKIGGTGRGIIGRKSGIWSGKQSMYRQQQGTEDNSREQRITAENRG